MGLKAALTIKRAHQSDNLAMPFLPVRVLRSLVLKPQEWGTKDRSGRNVC